MRRNRLHYLIAIRQRSSGSVSLCDQGIAIRSLLPTPTSLVPSQLPCGIAAFLQNARPGSTQPTPVPDSALMSTRISYILEQCHTRQEEILITGITQIS